MARPRTLYEKIWDAHVVAAREDGTCLIYIDRHLVHEVTSPQAFEALRLAGRKVRRPDLTLAVPDHNLADHAAAAGTIAADRSCCASNAEAVGIRYIAPESPEQGIVHVVGPEQGFTLPGTTIVCGDSHTAAHGALARSPSASAPARSSMSSPPRRCCCASRRRWRCASKARSAPASPPRT